MRLLQWQRIGGSIWWASVRAGETDPIWEGYRIRLIGWEADSPFGARTIWREVIYYRITAFDGYKEQRSPACESLEEAQALAERHLADGCAQLPSWPEYLTADYLLRPR